MQKLRIKPTLRTALHNQKTSTKVSLWVLAFVMAFSSLSALVQQSSHASVPVYNQESGAGFGDRRLAHSYNDAIAFDTSGNFFIGIIAGNNSFIRKFSPSGAFMKDFDVSDTTNNSDISYNTQYGRLAVDNNNLLYAIDFNQKSIHVFDTNGVFQTAIANPVLRITTDIMFDHSNNYYLTDQANHRVQKYAHDGTLLYNIGGPAAGSGNGQFNTPGEVAVDSYNNLVVTDTKNYRIQMFNQTGTFLRTFGQKNTALYCPAQPSLDAMSGLVVDQQDNIYVATHAPFCSNNIQKFDNSGAYITTQVRPRSTNYMRISPTNIVYNVEAGANASITVRISQYGTDGSTIDDQTIGNPSTLARPVATAQDSLGNTYVADSANSRIQKYDVNRIPVLTFGSNGSGDGKFQSIGGIAIDKNDVIYVTDFFGRNVQKFDTSGTFIAKFGSAGPGDGQFNGSLYKIAVQPNGNLIILDGKYSPDTRLNIMTSSGAFVAKIAQSGIRGFAQKSNGDITILTSSQFYTYRADGTPITFYSNSFSNPQTGTNFKAGSNLAYDKFDNLYADGIDSARARYAGGGSSIARLNPDEPELPGYAIIAPSVVSDDSDMYFSPSSQLFLPDSSRNYVRVYNTIATLQPPTAPTNLTAIPRQSSTVDVSWQPPTSSGAIVSYRIEYKPHAYGQWLTYGTIKSLTATVPGLVDDVYDIRVSAIGEAGAGTPAEVENVTVHARYTREGAYTPSDGGQIQAIAFDAAGQRYETDAYNNRVNVYSPAGIFLRSFGGPESGDGQLNNPNSIAISPSGRVYVGDAWNNRVVIFGTDGNFISSFGDYGSGDGLFYNVGTIAIDSSEDIYVVNSYENVQVFNRDGVFIKRYAATDYPSPTGIMIDHNDNIFIAGYDPVNEMTITKYSLSGTSLLTFGSYGSGDGQLDEVFTMALNDQNEIIVNDTWNYRIQIFDASGRYLEQYGRGYGEGSYLQFNDTKNMALDNTGKIYMPDAYNPSVQTFAPANRTPSSTTAPSAPQSVTANSTTENQVALTWVAPDSDGGAPITSYTIEYKLTTDSAWSSVTSTTLTKTLVSLPAGTYTVRLSATNSVGSSPSSTPITVTVTSTPATTTPIIPPSQPAKSPSTTESSSTTTPPVTTSPTAPVTTSKPAAVAVATITSTVNPTTGLVTITWQSPVDGSTPIHYVVEYQPDNRSESDPWQQATQKQADQRSASFHIPEGDYRIRVAAVFADEGQSRAILGITHISVPAKVPVISEGNTSRSVPATAQPNHALRNIILACVGGIMLALFFFILVVWKKRRRAKTAATLAQPPRRW